ncbi:MAG: hypothetical protein U1E08_04705 [Coriobacteriia bacterium]|nr:hypothetical protein [Actinomycetota bacterium]MDZ4166975.1 hypothetical protein [Coriobacteriia bacterium]
MSDAFWSSWWWPLATGLIGFVYVGLLVAQWLRRRKPHQLAWAVGFAFYAIAAVMEAYSEFTGAWDPTVYRIYIVLAASLVGFLGLGTLYLVTRKPLAGNVYLAFVLACLAVFFYGTFTTELVTSQLVPGITVGGTALGSGGSFPRVMSLPFNITGTLLLVGGSLFSIFKFLPRKEFRYRVWANVLIIVGTLIIAGAGSMARAGKTVGLYPAEMIASAVLLAGFLLAGTLEKGARAIKERRDADVAG